MSVIDRVLGRAAPESTDRLDLHLDELFRLLSNSRRRFIIDYVGSMNEDESVTVNDLARAIAYIENDVPDLDAVNRQQYKRVYISLTQSHMENLDAAGLVEWDDQAQTASPSPHTRAAWEVVRETNAILSPEVPA